MGTRHDMLNFPLNFAHPTCCRRCVLKLFSFFPASAVNTEMTNHKITMKKAENKIHVRTIIIRPQERATTWKYNIIVRERREQKAARLEKAEVWTIKCFFSFFSWAETSHEVDRRRRGEAISRVEIGVVGMRWRAEQKNSWSKFTFIDSLKLLFKALKWRWSKKKCSLLSLSQRLTSEASHNNSSKVRGLWMVLLWRWRRICQRKNHRLNHSLLLTHTIIVSCLSCNFLLCSQFTIVWWGTRGGGRSSPTRWRNHKKVARASESFTGIASANEPRPYI